MKRIVLAVAALALGMVAASGQSEDPVLERSKLMKTQGQHVYGTFGRMTRGQEPYDQAKVDAAFASLADTSKRITSLFPELSKDKSDPDGKYFASSKIWENKQDFESLVVKLKSTIAEYAAKTKSLDDLKTNLATLRQACESCHEPYRVKKS